jgi:phage gpG-like protein
VEKELRQEVEKLSIQLVGKVQKEKLSGQVLKNRTGTLRRSINYKIETTQHSVYGTVGTNKEYGAIHEYGYHGPVNVREHLRMIKQAFGRSINPREITVQAHTRQVNLPEKSFLRSALKEMEPEIINKLTAAAERGARKS